MSEGNYNKEGIGNILTVAISVCLVCSIVVSVAAVSLKPAQQVNKELDRKRNILIAAGMLADGSVTNDAGLGIEELFTEFDGHVVELASGEYAQELDATNYDQLRAAKDPAVSSELSATEDVATLGRLENYGTVYLKEDAAGALDKVVIPIRGYGLWGTLYGYIALESDLDTVAGLAFYRHQETPGLGGEVDNSKWKAAWIGVDVFEDGAPVVRLVKSRSREGTAAASHEVDALSGATLTTRGVENLVNFWLGEQGYGPYLANLRKETGA